MKVLVPYDGSEQSEQAAVMAIELLAQHRVDLTLLHVAPDPAHAAAATANLEAVVQRLARSPDNVSAAVVFGRPEEEIARYADQHGADVIAMSTHGRSMLARMLVGSVTDRVIRTSPVPILVLHPPTMSIDRVSPPAGRKLRVLAPFDGSTFAANALTMAVSLLRPEHIELTMLTAVVVPDFASLAREPLEETASQLREQGVTVTTQIAHGDAAPAIMRQTREGGYDLVVMSTHGHGMIARALLGSTADKAVRMSEVPVLVVQPQLMETPHDPVSGEDIDPDRAEYTSEYHGRVYAFSSLEHKQLFDGTPEAYVGARMARPGRISSPDEGLSPRVVPPML